MKTSEVTLFKPRDGYRTRVGPTVLGPVIDYYLPSAPSEAVVIEILDAKGNSAQLLQQRNSRLASGRGGGGGTCRVRLVLLVQNRNPILMLRRRDVSPAAASNENGGHQSLCVGRAQPGWRYASAGPISGATKNGR